MPKKYVKFYLIILRSSLNVSGPISGLQDVCEYLVWDKLSAEMLFE